MSAEHDFRNGIGNIAGIMLEIRNHQEVILNSQRRVTQLFLELHKQLLRVLTALEVKDADK